MDKVQLKDDLTKFVESLNKSFSFEQLLEVMVEESDDEVCKEIWKLCKSSRELELIHYFQGGQERFVRRNILFDGAQFCIKPTKAEIDGNLLFVGHRFMPFCNQNITPRNIIFQDKDKSILEKLDYKIPLEEAEIYYSLFGRLGMIGVYTFDHEENIRVIEEHGFESIITVPVFDMKSFYSDNKFKYDDIIIAEVINWKAGIAKVKDIKRSNELQNSFANITDWASEFSRAVRTVCKQFGPATTADKQLERVFASHPNLLIDPIIHIGGAIKLDRELAIQEVGGNCVLWDISEDPEECLSLLDYGEDSFDHSNEPLVDQIMIEQGIPYSSQEIEALIRNELFNKIYDGAEAVYSKYFSIFGNDIDTQNLSVIKSYIADVYDEIKQTYNPFADNNAGILRANLIKVKLKMVNWLIYVEDSEIDIEDLPTKRVLQFTEIMSYVTHSLTMCNDCERVISKQDLDITLKRLEELDEHVTILMKEIVEF